MNEQKNNLSISSAIIIAGIIIALGIFLSGRPATTNKAVNVVKNSDVVISPITEKDHIRGNPNAPITIVEFSDTECPYCKMFQNTMIGVMDTYGKDGSVAWVYKQFPLDQLHPKARNEAEATECVNDLGGNTAFWKMLDTIYINTPANNGLDPAQLPVFAKEAGVDVVKFNACLSSGKFANLVESHIQEAVDAGARGTPYSVMVLKNAISDEIKNKIDEYVVRNEIFDQNGAPVVYVSKDKTKVVAGGNLPLNMMKDLINMLLNK